MCFYSNSTGFFHSKIYVLNKYGIGLDTLPRSSFVVLLLLCWHADRYAGDISITVCYGCCNVSLSPPGIHGRWRRSTCGDVQLHHMITEMSEHQNSAWLQRRQQQYRQALANVSHSVVTPLRLRPIHKYRTCMLPSCCHNNGTEARIWRLFQGAHLEGTLKNSPKVSGVISLNSLG